MIHLILGGARSGKSAMAEKRAQAYADNQDKNLIYIATAQARDGEMRARIQKHQNDRANNWQVIEEPINLANIIEQHDSAENCILVDCLTLWVSNCMCDVSPSDSQSEGVTFDHQKSMLLNALENASSSIILVSNEVGHGIVPMGELSRNFVDQSGWLHQDIAKIADSVEFVIAGLAMNLKGASQ